MKVTVGLKFTDPMREFSSALISIEEDVEPYLRSQLTKIPYESLSRVDAHSLAYWLLAKEVYTLAQQSNFIDAQQKNAYMTIVVENIRNIMNRYDPPLGAISVRVVENGTVENAATQ